MYEIFSRVFNPSDNTEVTMVVETTLSCLKAAQAASRLNATFGLDTPEGRAGGRWFGFCRRGKSA